MRCHVTFEPESTAGICRRNLFGLGPRALLA
jgi:hypothetical protein